ncbi:hypothetical protein [Mucilaginibacter rubeus]|uniref:Uncharacterized protein n=1 Tax=Mucilaginibacter rubeus TaxID=2027860 RepID=A0A5C1HW15_9SPHI|nr:hypothetical protein [Mucilaginibacter rubeus]QEM09271.1 hypothetical protein DEO27_004335 [Mucilaginibacter rubeus]
MTNDTITKKYKLKPGLHQFAPGSAAVHCNDNLSDEEAEWYLQRYPHIAKLFSTQPPKGGVIKTISKSTKASDKGGTE